jgi:hypothetical protein
LRRSPAELGPQPGEGLEIALVVAGEAHDHVRGPHIRETTEKFACAASSAGRKRRRHCSPQSSAGFTEGFDTADLRAARTLLDDLENPTALDAAS